MHLIRIPLPCSSVRRHHRQTIHTLCMLGWHFGIDPSQIDVEGYWWGGREARSH